MTARDDKKEVMTNGPDACGNVAPPGLSSDGPGVSKVALPEPDNGSILVGSEEISLGYSAEFVQSYAAARVAESTAELQRRVAELEANDQTKFSAPVDASIESVINAIIADRQWGK